METPKPFSPNSSTTMTNSQNPIPANPNSQDKTAQNSAVEPPRSSIGFLEVFIHEARDIHNICIYHKQDVYAKLSLTSNPESATSTQIINGGGRNPVFNQSLRLSVQTLDSSLKCEVWMLSRVKNYLEDQLLGFALVPLSDVIITNDKLVGEFSLSSTDLYHSPAGFVQLSVSYTGSSPEVLALSPSPKAAASLEKSECDLEMIEFPDLNVLNENKMMVSEYFGIPCTNVDSEVCPDNEAGVRVVECLAAASSSESGNGVPENEGNRKKEESAHDTEVESSCETIESKENAENEVFAPVLKFDIEKEQTVVQEEIVEMYMKSMQQFTESLAKMKLPMDIEVNNNNSGTTTTPTAAAENGESKKSGPRVFYGSSAFF